MCRRPSFRNARTASPVDGGVAEANAVSTGSRCREPQARATRCTPAFATWSLDPAAASTRASSSRTRAAASAARRRTSRTSRKLRQALSTDVVCTRISVRATAAATAEGTSTLA